MEVGVVMRRRRLALVWVLMLLLSQCTGHIRLTFPPARKYQLDFLDNVRTKGPCGMPPGLGGERTSLEAGSDLEVHWHLSYPHRGGYFFQLLDQNNTVTYRYPAEPNSFLGTQDGTSIQATVPIPDDTCDLCTLRMVRQAREWGGNYLFWSCADVTVQQAVAPSDLCSGHGDAQGGQCRCDPLYLGDRCQFKDECVIDSDCGPHGRCEDIQATSYPKRQCYCSQGWFGPRCQHQSTVQNKPTDLSGYTTRTLSADSDITVYYRTVQDEVEVIMKARTNSWMALGWRPAGIGRSCQNFPDLGDGYDEGDDGESVTPETTAEGTPETTAEGTPETTAEGTPETTAEGTPETTAEGTPETTAEGTPEGTPEATPEGESGPPLHAMDCTDIIIGSARGDYSRIGDYYTRDRSTPVWDEYLGGQNSLTAGLVWEEGQHTWMLFRRKLTSNDTADHSLEDETTHVIWAVGQHADADGRYNHWPKSALESGSANITDFYRQDELKYHGHKGQRGATALNFHAVDEPVTDSDNCTQGSCPSSVCGLDFSWTYDSDTDLITFNISASPVSPNQWIALGFSDDHYMANSDVIYGAAGGGPEGDPFVTDGWLFARAPPSKDDQSDAVLVSGQHADGTTTLVFSRPRTTNDSEDLDLSECRYVFFANNGGEVSPQGITKHTSTPIVSSQKICFGFCQPEVTTGTDTTETDAVTVTTGGDATTSADHTNTTTVEDTIDRPKDIERKVRYRTPASIRLPEEDYTPELSDSTSPYFIREAKIIGSFMFVLLHPFLPDKLMDIFVKAFRRGSVIVDVEVETIHNPGVPLRQIQEEVESAVFSSFNNQTLEGYGVMHVISVSSPVRDEKPDEDDSVLTEVEIIIVVIASALVLLAILIGVCKYVETRRSAASQSKPKASSSRDSASASSGSDRSSRKETMSYSEFLALEAEAKQEATPPFYSAFDNPAYESVGTPYVP